MTTFRERVEALRKPEHDEVCNVTRFSGVTHHCSCLGHNRHYNKAISDVLAALPDDGEREVGPEREQVAEELYAHFAGPVFVEMRRTMWRSRSGRVTKARRENTYCEADAVMALYGAIQGQSHASRHPMDEPEGGFAFADLWAAYETGAKDAREHHPASDALIGRSADAYCKSKAVRGPSTIAAEEFDDASRAAPAPKGTT